MITKLVKHGSSFALLFPKTLRMLLKISPSTPLELTTDGKTVVIKPVFRFFTEKEFKASAKRINKKRDEVFERLADL